MKEVTCYITSDGTIHTDLESARRRAEANYANVMTVLVHGWMKTWGYVERAEFLDRNLGEFVKLAKLKEDCILEAKEDDDGE